MRSPAKAIICSKLAIATALVVGATPAAAQGINGTVNPSSTGISAPVHVGNTTTIDVTANQAVINWTATGPSGGGLTTFQNSSQTLTFQGGTNFAVLNRVTPTVSTDAIYMNGTVNSLVDGVRGGTVYFYSPRGVVIGDSGRINVGSLGLTTSTISDDGQGNWMTGFGTASPQVSFGGAAVGSYVRVDTLAQVNANGSGNYVALVAPHVALNGTIRTDGAAALVGASAATITFSTDNLFDIVVTTGSEDSVGVVVNGGTIERNSATIGGDHRAYLVAVPANNAMTMLIGNGADLGFDIAGSAGVEGNAVVLSAGRNIFNGENVGPPNTTASASIDRSTFTSNVIARTTENLLIGSSTGVISFSGSLDATAGDLLNILATDYSVSIGGNLTANVDRIAFDAVGGDINLLALNGNTLSVGGSASLSANGTGFAAVDDGLDAGNGRGGNVSISADGGGILSFGLGLTATADGAGGVHSFTNGAAGDGYGGTVSLFANNGSSITVGGATELSAKGSGGSPVECSGCTISGGYGEGGTIDVNGGFGGASSLALNGGLNMVATGDGGAGDAGAGNGKGGDASLASGDGSILTIGDHLFIRAGGSGGTHLGTGTGGSGVGGSASISHFGVTGGSITAAGVSFDVEVNADGKGGNSLLLGGAGGYAEGGTAFVNAPSVAVTINGGLLVSAKAEAGDSNGGAGGAALGGTTQAIANGGNLTINGNLSLRSEALGGSGLTGGAAQGGTATVSATGGAVLKVTGLSALDAYGYAGSGGFGVGGIGGRGDGGTINLFAAGGSQDLYDVELNADAEGGDARTGGLADGGTINVSASAGGAIDVGFEVNAWADARGGSGYDANGGDAKGGTINITADNATINVDDALLITAMADAGYSGGTTTSGGYGEGGTIGMLAKDGGTLTVLSTLSANASGRGGGSFEPGASGGAGKGGTVLLRAIGGGSTVDAKFRVALDANGEGGFAGGDCSACGGAGADGTGGVVQIVAQTGTGNRVLVGSDLEMNASGFGSSGYGGAGGDGAGGDAYINIFDDGKLDVDGNLTLTADGSGGGQSNGLQAGNGVGGEAWLNLTGTAAARVDVGGISTVTAYGSGGTAFDVAGGTGGNGQGGFARIFGTGGLGTFTGAVLIAASGTGGDSFGGTGGNGVGGLTRLNGDGASFNLLSNLTLHSISTGGDGAVGGDALAFIGTDPKNTATTDARVLARSATVSVVGTTSLDVSASGGSSQSGNAGGDAKSGYATVHARNGDAGAALVSLASLTVNASVSGGAGGAAVDGSGGTGGAGGSATGGFVAITGSAGNGVLNTGAVTISGGATGGAGGNGGSSIAAVGGNGGTGGAADGANVLIGTETGDAAAFGIGQGGATFASITSTLDTVGGRGGDGGAGTSSGVGGTGGSALGGDIYLITRGSVVQVGAVTFTGHATGGAGGRDAFEALSGTGGNALAGGLGIDVAHRGGNTALRGTLNAGVVNMTSNSTGGAGLINGFGYAGGRNVFTVRNSNATFTSFSMVNGATSGVNPELILDPVYLLNGNVTVGGAFNFTSPAVMSLRVDNGTLSASSFTMSGGDFIVDSFHPAVTTLGTVSAGSITLLSGNDMIADANLSSTGPLTIDVLGDINIGSVIAGGVVTLDAGVNLTAGNVRGSSVLVSAGGIAALGNLTSTAGGIDVAGTGSVNLGNINSASFFFADTGVNLTLGSLTLTGDANINIGGDLTTGAISARDVNFEAGGNLITGNALVAQTFDVESGGSLTVGNITAGDSIGLDAPGAVVAGNLSAGLVNTSTAVGATHSIEIVSATSVAIGSAAAREWIGIGSLGSVAASGALNAGDDILILADGAIQLQGVTTGNLNRLLIAGSAMVEAGGGLEDFDRSLVYNAVDAGDGVPTAGNVTINGTVNSYKVDLLVGGGLTTGTINAEDLDADVGGTATLNGQWNTDSSTVLRSNDIAIGTNGGINGFEIVLLSSHGTQTLIGDGLSGSGYALSNAEFGRLNANLLSVYGNSSSSAAIDTLVGDLTLQSPGMQYGFVTLGTTNAAVTSPDGTIRIVGDVIGNGFGANEIMTVEADRIEIDAATATLALNDAPGELGGILILDADQVHVAEAEILDKLAADPGYAARASDLATPTATARPEGVVRASEIYVSLGGFNQAAGIGTAAVPTYSVMVQNTGTRETPAGFLANYAEIGGGGEGGLGAPIDMIVNGQLVTPDGTLTGVAVRDALMADDDPARFTATSTINGCALTGNCVFRPVPPPINPTPDIQTQISLIGTPTGDDLLFGNEETIEDNEEEGGEDSKSSPIQPPTPLFNTKPLEVPGETDEPVSGGGNPALVGNGPVDDEDDDEEDQ